MEGKPGRPFVSEDVSLKCNVSLLRACVFVCVCLCVSFPQANPSLAKAGKNEEEKEKPSLSKSNCSWMKRVKRGGRWERRKGGDIVICLRDYKKRWQDMTAF